jgi:Na+/proline symporter
LIFYQVPNQEIGYNPHAIVVFSLSIRFVLSVAPDVVRIRPMRDYALDLIIVGVYFTVIIGIGLRASRGQKTMESYALGDRSMPWWAVLASILASEISAGTFLGTPGEGFAKRNFVYAQLVIGTILARLLVAAIFIKPFYKYSVVSIYEFLEIRFGKLTRRMASFVFLLTRSLASGSRIFVAAILLVLAWQLVHPEFAKMTPDERFGQELMIYAVSVILITGLTALYTTLGGIKAVVWTDLIQVSLMFGAAIYVFFWLLGKTGGWAPFVAEIKTPIFVDTGIKPEHSFGQSIKYILEQEYTIWAALLGSIFTTLATHGTDQDMVQRMLTSKDAKRGQRAVIVSGLVDLPVVIGFLAIGILIYRYYQINPDGAPTNDVFAWFMLHDLSPGLRGLIAAGLFATAMGSLSTALNALATTFTKDWYLGVFRPKATSEEQMKAARVSTVVFALLLALIGIGTAFIKLKNPELRIIPIVLGSFGYTYGSLLGIFLVGMLTKNRGTCRGNSIAMIAGLCATLFLSGAHNDVYDIFHDKEARFRNAVKALHLATDDPSKVTTESIATKARLQLEDLPQISQHHNAQAPLFSPPWLPTVSFTWRIMIGTLFTVGVALLFGQRRETLVALNE